MRIQIPLTHCERLAQWSMLARANTSPDARVKLVPTRDASAPFGAKRNGGRSGGITSDETHDTPVSLYLPSVQDRTDCSLFYLFNCLWQTLVYETAPSHPPLLDGQQKVIVRADRPLTEAKNEEHTTLIKGHWRCVQLVALNLSLSETSMSTSTFFSIVHA
jgi:hypothetical protein